MRRILLVLSAAALIAAMMVAMAMPAFAGGTCNAPAGEFIQCAGGGGERGGGGGGRGADDLQTGAVVQSGGFGEKGGGGGSRCVDQDCVGSR